MHQLVVIVDDVAGLRGRKVARLSRVEARMQCVGESEIRAACSSRK
jgi:hypothetical protein